MCCWWRGSQWRSGSFDLDNSVTWPFQRPGCYGKAHSWLCEIMISVNSWGGSSEKWRNWHWGACASTDLMSSMCCCCWHPPCFTHQCLSSWQLLLPFVSQLMRTHLGSDWSPLVNCSASMPAFLTTLGWASISFALVTFSHHPLAASCLTFWKKPSLRWSGQLFKSSEESLQHFLASLFYTVGKVFKARRGGKMLTGVATWHSNSLSSNLGQRTILMPSHPSTMLIPHLKMDYFPQPVGVSRIKNIPCSNFRGGKFKRKILNLRNCRI